MLSKEEIEKAKDDLMFFNEGDYITREMDRSADILEKYIQELEESNKDLDRENNRLEKIEFERDMANKIIDKIIKDWKQDDYRSVEEIKRYFEKKVEKK